MECQLVVATPAPRSSTITPKVAFRRSGDPPRAEGVPADPERDQDMRQPVHVGAEGMRGVDDDEPESKSGTVPPGNDPSRGTLHERRAGLTGRSAAVGVHHGHQLVIHRLGLGVARADGRRGAMLEMVAHQFTPHAAQRLVDGGDLRQHVGAVAVLLDHPLQAAHLSLDTAQPGEVAGLDGGIDADRRAAADGASASSSSGSAP